MTTEILFLFVILAVMIYLFISNKLPVDLTAVTGLLVLTLFGYISASKAFVGFSSPAIVIMISTFFLGAALRVTGVAEMVAAYVYRVVKDSECLNIIAVMLVASLLSAFMTNIAATAVLLPSVMSIAHRTGIPPSKLLIPLAFGTILGGTTTLIGTTPNILIAEVVRDKEVRAFEFFDFFLVGMALVVVGTLFMAFVGRFMLPERSRRKKAVKGDLASLYKLHDHLVSLRVPKGSSLAGESLASAHFGYVLDAQVMAIIRGQEQQLAPSPKSVLEEDDVLIVRGAHSNLEQIFKFKGVQVKKLTGNEAEEISQDMTRVGLRLVEKGIADWTLDDLNFRKRYGVVVSAIERGDKFIQHALAFEPLCAGDILHVIASPAQIAKLKQDPYFRIVDSELSVSGFVKKNLFLMKIIEGSSFANLTLRESRMGELADLTVVGVIRAGNTILEVNPDFRIESGDALLVIGQPAQVVKLAQLAELEVDSGDVSAQLESDEVALVEAVLSPRSKLLDKTLKEIYFREKYGFQAIAIWREGKPLRDKVGVEPLCFGDALLLQGPRKKVSLLVEDPDFVILSDDVKALRKTKKAAFAVFGLLLMMALAAFQIQPIHIAAFIGAVFVVVTGAISMQEGYREVEWRVIFLIACLIPIGMAVENSGAASLVANNLIKAVGDFGPYAVLIAISLLASALSQTLDSSLTVVLLSPICISAALSLGVDPFPFLMVIALSASVAFLTPFSHKASLLVMGAGGYKVKDYFRVGIFLSIIAFALVWLLVPVIYSF